MIVLQILNKVLQTGDISLITKNNLSEEYFTLYEKEFNFIWNHYQKYHKVPDKETFLNTFQEFNLLAVAESDQYLIDTISEEYLYKKSAPIVTKIAELLKGDSNEAVDYMLSQIPSLTASRGIGGVDIIKHANIRYQEYLAKQETPDHGFIKSGFSELDNKIEGWAKGEEFVVILARTGQGKSWVLGKTCASAWQNSYRVGYISPEMSPSKLGYRTDTLLGGFSNTALVRGYNVEGYKEHIEALSRVDNPFIIATPKDFQRKITVSKLKLFCEINELEMLGIDGLTYLSDERKQRGDNRTTSLTQISEDIMALSCELKIPILAATQSNRKGAEEDGNPEIEHIKDSDGIAHNASKILSLKQNAGALDIEIKKYRDGANGGKFTYFWDIDKGQFNYVPSAGDANNKADREAKTQEIKNAYQDKTSVF